MKIIMVRHGQTDQNKKRIIQGRKNYPLNETGKNEIKQFAERFKHEYKNYNEIKAIYSSPLDRAMESASIINRILGLQLAIIPNESFLERDFGIFEDKDIHPNIFTLEENQYHCASVESTEEMMKRIYEGIKSLYLIHMKDTILITCHSHTIKSTLFLCENNQYDFQTPLRNAQEVIFDFDGEKLTIVHYDILNK